MVSTALFQAVITVLVFVLTMFMGAVAWYLRKVLIAEVKSNTEMRKFILGSDIETDGGEFENLNRRLMEMESAMDRRHKETRQWLRYLSAYVENISDEVNGDDIKPDVSRPNEFPRGGD